MPYCTGSNVLDVLVIGLVLDILFRRRHRYLILYCLIQNTLSIFDFVIVLLLIELVQAGRYYLFVHNFDVSSFVHSFDNSVKFLRFSPSSSISIVFSYCRLWYLILSCSIQILSCRLQYSLFSCINSLAIDVGVTILDIRLSAFVLAVVNNLPIKVSVSVFVVSLTISDIL